MDIVATTICLILGITTPSIESSIQGLDHPTFQIRNKSDQYLRNNLASIFRVWLHSNEDGMSLERKVRIDRISDYQINKWTDDYYRYIYRKWDMEGQAADLLFGDDWPSIRTLYHWEGESLGYIGMWARPRKFKYKDCTEEDPGWKLYKSYWDEDASYAIRWRMYNYYHSSDKIKWSVESLEKAVVKVWIIDELNKGTDPKYLAMILHVMRKKTLLHRDLHWWTSLQYDIERYNGPVK